MKIIGKYKFIDAETGRVLFQNHNLITRAGMSVLCDILVNGSESEENITLFSFGTGTGYPTLNDTKLVNWLIDSPITNKKSGNSSLKFETTLNTEEVVETSEIGLTTDKGTLICHDIHTPFELPTELSNITVDYGFYFTAGEYYKNWEEMGITYPNTYYHGCDDTIESIIEETGTREYWYDSVDSIEAVQNESKTYWHDTGNKRLYVHTSTDESPNSTDVLVNYVYTDEEEV